MDTNFSIFFAFIIFLLLMMIGTWLDYGGIELTIGSLFWAIIATLVICEN